MQTVKVNSLNAWFLAIRPKTLTGAVIPVMMGTSLALHDATVSWLPALGCLLFACAMQVAANFINDLYDFLKGSDRADRLGPERACAQGWITPEAMKAGIGVTLLLAAAAGLSVLWCVWSHLPCGGWELVVLGAICMLFAFL